MEIHVHEELKLVEIWLTRAEQEDQQLREQLRSVYRDYKEKKYMVAQFQSGQEDLYGLTRDLLLFNRKRIEELAIRQEKEAHPELTGSKPERPTIQC